MNHLIGIDVLIGIIYFNLVLHMHFLVSCPAANYNQLHVQR